MSLVAGHLSNVLVVSKAHAVRGSPKYSIRPPLCITYNLFAPPTYTIRPRDIRFARPIYPHV